MNRIISLLIILGFGIMAYRFGVKEEYAAQATSVVGCVIGPVLIMIYDELRKRSCQN